VVAETEADDDVKSLDIGDGLVIVGEVDLDDVGVLTLLLHIASILSGQHGSVDCCIVQEEGH
jgi:hypothetical protein